MTVHVAGSVFQGGEWRFDCWGRSWMSLSVCLSVRPLGGVSWRVCRSHPTRSSASSGGTRVLHFWSGLSTQHTTCLTDWLVVSCRGGRADFSVSTCESPNPLTGLAWLRAIDDPATCAYEREGYVIQTDIHTMRTPRADRHYSIHVCFHLCHASRWVEGGRVCAVGWSLGWSVLAWL